MKSVLTAVLSVFFTKIQFLSIFYYYGLPTYLLDKKVELVLTAGPIVDKYQDHAPSLVSGHVPLHHHAQLLPIQDTNS